MVSRLRPLDVTIAFEDKLYELGETISCDVELLAKADIDVREARVDLVCQVHWVDIHTVMVPTVMPSRGGAAIGDTGGVYVAPRIPKQVSKEYKESYVHSSAVFLQDTHVQSGRGSSYRVRLEIQPETPDNAEKGTVSWSVLAAIDISRARDINKKTKVRITLT
jgi:hypothetical protein